MIYATESTNMNELVTMYNVKSVAYSEKTAIAPSLSYMEFLATKSTSFWLAHLLYGSFPLLPSTVFPADSYVL